MKSVFEVRAWKWDSDKEYYNIYSWDYENLDEAITKFKGGEITADRPQWDLYEDTGYESFHLAVKDEFGIYAIESGTQGYLEIA